jgi:hypothetical protein
MAKFWKVNIWRAAWEACSTTWNFGTNSAFALGPRKTTGNLDRIGRSQDLPDANWLLASSPALNTRALTLFPYLWSCFIIKYVYSLCYNVLYSYNLDKQHTVYNTWENDGCLCLIKELASLLIISWYGLHREHRFQQLYFCVTRPLLEPPREQRI